jgi:arylsulfatase A-like enzyme
MRAVGFIHSALLRTRGYSYHGLVHVSDWFPTMYRLAGGDPSSLDGLDGHDVWAAITTNSSSPRTELLHNIDPVAPHPHGCPFGHAALRVGDLKLLVGSPGSSRSGRLAHCIVI